MRPGCLLAAVLIVAASASFPPAIEAAPSPAAKAEQAKTEAKKEFQAGVAAFKKKQYDAAAEHFERAMELAPHPMALWNAAEAREKAGDIVRAANHYAHYVSMATEKEKDRAEALLRLDKLEKILGVVEIFGPDASDVTIDDQRVVDLAKVYVLPGSHKVSGNVDGKLLTRRVTVKAGSSVKVRLAPEVEKPKEPVAPPVDQPVDKAPASGKPGPAIFWVGAGVTAVLGGVTLWSGLDTKSKRSDFDAHPTARLYDEGLAAQHRTNYLVGATAVAGVATAVLGAFVVQWKAPQEPKVGLIPGGASFSVRF